MPDIWMTELKDFSDCPQKWASKWKRRLRDKTRKDAAMPLKLGTSIHAGLEHGMITGDWAGVSNAALTKAFEQDIHDAEEIEKISAAINKIPDWLKEVKNPHAEQELRLEINSPDHLLLTRPYLAGKPDLWWIDDTGAHVLELKTTADHAKNRLRTLTDYDMQLRGYATLLYMIARVDPEYLQEWPRGLPVNYQYLVLSWRGQVGESGWMELGPAQAEAIWDHMCQQVGAMTVLSTIGMTPMNRGAMCKYCIYDPVCSTLLTGGDPADIIEAKYRVSEHKQERTESNDTTEV